MASIKAVSLTGFREGQHPGVNDSGRKDHQAVITQENGSGKSKLEVHRSKIEALLENGSTQKSIAARFNTSEVNLSRWLRKRGIRQKLSL